MAADDPSTLTEADNTSPTSGFPSKSSSTIPETSQQEKVNTDIEGSANVDIDTQVATPEHDYLTGIKLYGVAAALFTGSFLSILEISIVSTALINITDDLKSFDESSWIITAYLLTYTFSDTLGRRTCLGTALLIFIIGSGACGAAQTIDQLQKGNRIIFRALQGIGASGIVALTFVIIAELVPVDKYALYSGITAIIYGVAYLMGPLRWLFIINVPIGIMPLALLYIFMPANFPNWRSTNTKTSPTIQTILNIDYVGATSLFGFCVLLVAAFQEANTRYPWDSAVVIVLFIFSGIFLISFIGWQKYLSIITTSIKAIFPWRIMEHRLFMCAPFTVAVIQIPQRDQAVGATSPIRAGVNLLPFTLMLSVGSIFASISTSRSRAPPMFVFLVGAILQTVGCALMSTLGVHVGSKAYGYEVILALGLEAKINVGSIYLFRSPVTHFNFQAVGMGAVIQARPLGGAIGLAVTTTALNSYVKSKLSSILNPDDLSALLQSVQVIEVLPAELQAMTRPIFSEAYDLQMHIMIGFSAAQVLVAAAMWERKLTRVA
ncbi:MFS general substrate transporter [Mollisia scopiformis]|uniref:MFS general substrate transporter n=1 Tax=Mollisia scopiformis TaxID=149040 RepID=A0A194WSX4_MOLSC|nr:MFS general substrate transporter [Mollisia scopiformis]KUJ10779.1 MFS general substrate transporter [Mollisia scopiformis]